MEMIALLTPTALLMNQMPKVSVVNVILTTLVQNAELWTTHVANTIVEAHPMVDANLTAAVPHSAFALTDGPDLTARMTLTNAPKEPINVHGKPHATIQTVATNVLVVLDTKEMVEKTAKDVQILMNVSNKVITVVLNQSASTTTVVSHVNVNQDLLATHQLSDVPNQMKHHWDVNDSPVISILII